MVEPNFSWCRLVFPRFFLSFSKLELVASVSAAGLFRPAAPEVKQLPILASAVKNMPNITVARATRRDCDQIFELVNLAFKPEIGKTGIAYRKCDKYRLKDSARKHLEDMWVVKDNRKVSFIVKQKNSASRHSPQNHSCTAHKLKRHSILACFNLLMRNHPSRKGIRKVWMISCY